MPSSSLAELHGELTERTIVQAALRGLARDGEITARAAAKEAGISERTVFRYFPTRGELLAAAARSLAQAIRAPEPPATLEQLRAMPRALYTAFEEHKDLIRAAWHSELRTQMIATQAKHRWQAVRKLVDAAAPRTTGHRRKLAVSSICYYLTATTWHYHRYVFQFTLEDTIQAAENVIGQQLAALARN